jgi:hypothetical protein
VPFAHITCCLLFSTQIDGMEFESSSVALDLRFVPDDMQFDAVTVRDSATAISSTYTPPTFIFKALQQTKVCNYDIQCSTTLLSYGVLCCTMYAVTYCLCFEYSTVSSVLRVAGVQLCEN